MEPVDQLLLGEQDRYGIFQLKHIDENRVIRFMSHDFLQQSGIGIDRENYELVYTAPLTEGVTLEELYEKFNMHRPEDFTGHSLSVSDVVVLHQKGENVSHYVDSFGFTEVPEFHRYPTIEEQIAKEETIDLLQDQEEQVTAIQSGNISQQEDDRPDSISYYVIEDLATWANHSKERSPLERFENIDDAVKQFRSYREQEWEYSDDSARTTLGKSINGIEFDMIHVRNNENYLVQDFTYINGIENNIGFIDDLQAILFISELIEKIPDVKVYGTLEPWLQKHAEKIASEADQLSYDYDPYEYRDQVEDREEHLQNITTDIRNGQTEYMEDFLNALIAEETSTEIPERKRIEKEIKISKCR